jgi:hypothetical protein
MGVTFVTDIWHGDGRPWAVSYRTLSDSAFSSCGLNAWWMFGLLYRIHGLARTPSLGASPSYSIPWFMWSVNGFSHPCSPLWSFLCTTHRTIARLEITEKNLIHMQECGSVSWTWLIELPQHWNISKKNMQVWVSWFQKIWAFELWALMKSSGILSFTTHF